MKIIIYLIIISTLNIAYANNKIDSSDIAKSVNQIFSIFISNDLSSSAQKFSNQGAAYEGSILGNSCTKGNNETYAPIGAQAQASYLSSSSDYYTEISAKEKANTIQGLYKKLKNGKQKAAHQNVINFKKAVVDYLEQDILIKETSVTLLDTATTVALADAVARLESMFECKDAVVNDYNILIGLYNDQIQLYSAAGAYTAEDEIRSVNGYELVNNALTKSDDHTNDWETVDNSISSVFPILQKLGSGNLVDVKSTKAIPQIIKTKWACASALRLNISILDRPYTDGGINSHLQALNRFSKHSEFTNALLKSCDGMITHQLTGMPENVTKACATFINNESNVLNACQPMGNSQSKKSDETFSNINNARFYLAEKRYQENNHRKVYPQHIAEQTDAQQVGVNKGIKISNTEIKKLKGEIQKQKSIIDNQTFINHIINFVTSSIQKIINIAYAKNGRIMNLTKTDKPLGCLLRKNNKGQCPSFAHMWNAPRPGSKLLNGRLDKSIFLAINLGDKMQGHTHLDESSFTLMENLNKQRPLILSVKKEMENRLNQLYTKDGYTEVTHEKNVISVLEKWQKITKNVLKKMGKTLSFSKIYVDPYEGKTQYKKSVITTPKSKIQKKIAGPTIRSSENYQEMKDADAVDINKNKDTSLFKTISKKYLKKIFLFID